MSSTSTIAAFHRRLFDDLLVAGTIILLGCCSQHSVRNGVGSRFGFVVIVEGYQNGAGSCVGGKPAVGGDHLDTYDDVRQAVGFPLEKGKVSVLLDDELLIPSETKSLVTQTDYVIKLVTEYEEGFKGVLIRLEAPGGGSTVGTAAALTPVDSTMLKVADLCEAPVAGVTHTNNSTKTSVEVTFRLDQAVSGAKLDITMVAINDIRASLYGYDYFLFDFTGDSAPVDTAPVSPSAPSSGGGTGGSAPSTPSPTISTNLENDIEGTFAPVPSPTTASSSAFESSLTPARVILGSSILFGFIGLLNL